ncbi:restriction endonuclease [Flavobacterium sp. RSB2_4_14]|uniref:restriction endonuclease n=1 Tax=Flavobacterium sp. RSB2_4_14 TaxID=3447665 RepID=UPI003F363350
MQKNKCPELDNFLTTDEIQRGLSVEFTNTECIRNYFWGECGGSCNQYILENSEYHLLEENISQYGFKKYTTNNFTNAQGNITTVQNVVQGFYIDDNKSRAIISNVANEQYLPKEIIDQLSELISVDYIYEGYEFLLVKVKEETFTFNIQFYQNIKEIIRDLNYHINSSIEKYYINKSGTILIIDTGETKFLISATLISDTEEIERAILTSKLAEAKPFFEFIPVNKVDWKKLKDDKGDYFEKLVETILPLEKNITIVETIGKTRAGDRGRDFIVIEETNDTFGTKLTKKWLVQCKFSENSISPRTIPDWVTRIVEHNVDGYWLITNNDLTPDLYDQMHEVPKNEKYKFETRIWQRNTFDIKFSTHPEIFKKGLFFNE